MSRRLFRPFVQSALLQTRAQCCSGRALDYIPDILSWVVLGGVFYLGGACPGLPLQLLPHFFEFVKTMGPWSKLGLNTKCEIPNYEAEHLSRVSTDHPHVHRLQSP